MKRFYKLLLLMLVPFMLCTNTYADEMSELDDLGSGFEKDTEVKFDNKITAVEITLLGIFVVVSIVGVTVIILTRKKGKNTTTLEFTIMSDRKYNKVLNGYDRSLLIDNAYKVFLTIKKAYMVFDYETIKNNTNSEMYNKFEYNLKLLKQNNCINEFHDFKLINGNVLDAKRNENNVNILMFFAVDFYDFISSDGVILHGFNDSSVVHYYQIEFILENDVLKMTDIKSMNGDVR